MLLEVDNITVGYGRAPVLSGVSLTVDKGELICIIGPNGAGKSTVLRAVAGQLFPSEGAVRFKGRDISRSDISERGRQGLVCLLYTSPSPRD